MTTSDEDVTDCCIHLSGNPPLFILAIFYDFLNLLNVYKEMVL